MEVIIIIIITTAAMAVRNLLLIFLSWSPDCTLSKHNISYFDALAMNPLRSCIVLSTAEQHLFLLLTQSIGGYSGGDSGGGDGGGGGGGDGGKLTLARL